MSMLTSFNMEAVSAQVVSVLYQMVGQYGDGGGMGVEMTEAEATDVGRLCCR